MRQKQQTSKQDQKNSLGGLITDMLCLLTTWEFQVFGFRYTETIEWQTQNVRILNFYHEYKSCFTFILVLKPINIVVLLILQNFKRKCICNNKNKRVTITYAYYYLMHHSKSILERSVV